MEQLRYADGDLSLTGDLVRPQGVMKGSVLILPTIFGRAERMRFVAQQLAQMGYAAMVADYYGRESADRAVVSEWAAPLRADPVLFRRRLAAALDTFQRATGAEAGQTVAIGYCMGGQGALELARAKAAICGAVSFHGILSTKAPAAPNGVMAKLLVLHGHDDPLAPPADVQAFQQEMTAAGANWRMVIYGNTRHGFTDPASDTRKMPPLAYNPEADKDSWHQLETFLAERFQR